jgi:hypothetical protein
LRSRKTSGITESEILIEEETCLQPAATGCQQLFLSSKGKPYAEVSQDQSMASS